MEDRIRDRLGKRAKLGWIENGRERKKDKERQLEGRESNGVNINSLLLRVMCNAHDEGQVSTLK